jgi:hypothetical protein
MASDWKRLLVKSRKDAKEGRPPEGYGGECGLCQYWRSFPLCQICCVAAPDWRRLLFQTEGLSAPDARLLGNECARGLDGCGT